MDDSLAVQVLHRFHHGDEYPPDLSLWEQLLPPPLLFDQLRQISSLAELEDHVEGADLLVPERAIASDDVGVIKALQDLYLVHDVTILSYLR